ncbi:MAG: hypothetical protein J0H14_08450 [Alphaproteobacteria bacterium]|nr:hypothetical protein [Alphaproteobacteria bacterium]
MSLSPKAVSDDDVHAACLSLAANIDLAEEIGAAEFRAALAPRERPRRRPGTEVPARIANATRAVRIAWWRAVKAAA